MLDDKKQKTLFQQFFQSNQQFEVKLKELIAFVKYQHPSLQFTLVTSPADLVMAHIKWLLFLHALILDSEPSAAQSKVAQQLTSLNYSQAESQFDNLLVISLLKPYKLYLQRRQALRLQQLNSQQQGYVLINMLRRALGFTDIVFTLGRYLFHRHRFLVHFNILMAKDINNIYSRLTKSMDLKIGQANANLIEKINQGLYNLYYNCYFSQYVKNSVPIWIDCQKLHGNANKQNQNIQIQKTIRKNAQEVKDKIFCFQTIQSSKTLKIVDMQSYCFNSNSTIGSRSEFKSLEVIQQEFSSGLNLSQKQISAKKFIQLAQQIIEKCEQQQQSSSHQLII